MAVGADQIQAAEKGNCFTKLNLSVKIKKIIIQEVEFEHMGELDKFNYGSGIFPQFNFVLIYHLLLSH